SRCDLLQKLQRRTSPLFPFFDMPIGSFFRGYSEIVGPELPPSQLIKACGHSARLDHPERAQRVEGSHRESTEYVCHEIPRLASLARDDRKTLLAFCDHLINDTIVARLGRREDEVAIGILVDLVERLSRVIREDLGEAI